MGRLTARKVDSLTAPGRYSDDDGSGFHLRVASDGGKYYILRVHVDGKRKDISIGSAKRITLAVAREKARKMRETLDATGIIKPGEIPTFAEAARSAHTALTTGLRNRKHKAQWLSTLETYAFPVVAEKPIDKVGRADIVEILAPIWLAKRETADRTLQRIDRVLSWAVGSGYREARIDMTLVRDALPRRPRRKRSSINRMAAVPWPEAPAFWAEMPLSASAPEVRMALAFYMLTAVRPGNIAQAKRGQLDLAAAVWTIPGDEMKSGEPHRVPLSPAAAEIARSMMLLHNHDLLFSMHGKPLSPDTLRMMMRRMGRSETPHGFRSTFKDWARASGYQDDLSEVALAHADPNEVRAAYARDDLLEERRPMMLAWSEYLAGKPHKPATTAQG